MLNYNRLKNNLWVKRLWQYGDIVSMIFKKKFCFFNAELGIA